jgi:peroxiredoxin
MKCWTLELGLILFLSPLTVFAQAGRGPAQPPPLRRPAGRPEGLTVEMEALLKKLIATYQNASTYRDQGRARIVQQAGRVRTTTEMPMEVTFQRPNLLRLEAGQYSVDSDGQTLFFVVPSLNQYTSAKAPEKIEKKHLLAGSILGGSDEGHPDLIDFLIRPDAYQALLAQIVKIAWKPDATVDGMSCRVLYYETTQGVRLSTFVDPKRMVVLKVEAETPGTTAEAAASQPIASPPQPPTTLIYEFFPVEVDAQLEPALFGYQPPAAFRRVAQIGASEPPGLQESRSPATQPAAAGSHLVGKPAPPLSGKDLSGKAVAPADLAGKVVLLFFWSLSGGEHSLLSIPVVQQVTDQYKNRPEVLVLGISGDEDKPQIVAQLLERKKASFRTVLDQEMKMQRSFELGGLPTFVIIGSDGKISWASLGAPPTLKQDLISEIEKALPQKVR